MRIQHEGILSCTQCNYVGAIIGAISTAASIAASAYQASQAGGGFAGAPPQPFTPVDIASTNQGLRDIIGQSYNLSDADLAGRLPGLVTTNQANIADAYKQLTGPLDPAVQNAFATRGIESALGATGGGNASASITPSGASGNAVATSIARDTMAKQDYDRQYLDQLIAANPERALTLSGSEAANLSAFNTQATNEYNWQKYAYQLQKENLDNAGGGF